MTIEITSIITISNVMAKFLFSFFVLIWFIIDLFFSFFVNLFFYPTADTQNDNYTDHIYPPTLIPLIFIIIHTSFIRTSSATVWIVGSTFRGEGRAVATTATTDAVVPRATALSCFYGKYWQRNRK